MKPKFKITFIVFALTTATIFGQTPKSEKITKPKYERVSQAYGYLLGQEYSLSLIKSKFNNLVPIIFRVQSSFNSTFGSSKGGMKNYLIEILTENKFNSLEEDLLKQIKKITDGQILTEEIAINFLSEIESRAKGNIASPILETLLFYQYNTRPHQELLDGFTRIFKTKGHPKSKNTDWQIEVPISWRASETDRPNIIQNFTADFGDSFNKILLMVKEMELPKGHKLSSKEIKELFTEEEAKKSVPEGGQFISFTKMTIENNDGGMLEIEQAVSRLDITMKFRIVQFMFVRKNKMYFLQGAVGSEKTNIDLVLEMKKYLPLYRLVANSIVVNDQYK